MTPPEGQTLLPPRLRLRRGTRRLVTSLAGRLKPVAPAPVWAAWQAARSLAGSGPLVAPPHADRVLVIAPHPDDETIGCGATIAGLAERGADVRVLVATPGGDSVALRGTAEDTAGARRREVEAACRALGVAAPTVLDLPDGGLADHLDELAEAISGSVATLRPEAVFVPWPLDGHPDHTAAAAAVGRVALPPGAQVWAYEVWTPLPPNRVVDATACWARKEAALRCHASAHGAFDASAHLALGRWRSVFGLDGSGYAEAYLVTDADGFRRLLVSEGSGKRRSVGTA